jgi:hypothetical protein
MYVRLLYLPDNNKGSAMLGPSFPTNPFDSIIMAQSGKQKMECVSITENPICFQINKHITKMLQKQGRRFDAFAWIM